MTLCPVALAVGCRRCALFKVCPGKSLIGDWRPDQQDQSEDRDEPKR